MGVDSYSPPVDKLLTYGDAHEHGGDPQDWPEYLELGIGPEHIPDLIRMATDEELRWAELDTLEVWAPIHAWRTARQTTVAELVATTARPLRAKRWRRRAENQSHLENPLS